MDMMDILDDDLDILEIIEYGFPRRINLRRNYFEEMDNLTFFQTFRLYKETFLHILALIEENLEYPDNRNNSVSPCNQLLCALRFYASSGHLRSAALFIGIDTSTACRIVNKVSQEIARLYPLYIRMPTQQATVAEQEKFFAMYGFPRVIGAVDGTHIKLQSPGGNDGEVYRNRKGFFSFNVQVIANADLKFIDVVARWPGSTHDATIFANSRVKARMDAGEYANSVLLGDSGYPLREYFLTPLEHPANEAEENYNRCFIRTRNSIERAIGLWKRRFPIIAYSMRVKNATAMTIIIATALEPNNLGSTTGAVSHFEPQVAILCDAGPRGQEAYQPKYMTEQGEWASDLRSKAACLKDKMDILNYCKMVYPKRDITNIVESSHYLKIASWCRAGATPGSQSRGKCKTARWVKPFRCLEGPFQSDALLVPENCMFDHIHNQSNCWTFGRWNATAGNACQEKGLQLRSFAMLLPCGISLFSGVEFVCCPKHFKENVKPKKPIDLTILKKEQDVFSDTLDEGDDDSDEEEENDDLDDLVDDTELSDEPSIDDDEDDDEDDDDYDDTDWDTTPQSTTAGFKSLSTSTTTSSTTTTTEKPTTEATPDPYFTHFDPRNEHQSYKEAQERLEETHREKVTRVMKDWSDLEERYQDMRSTDPRGADEFKQRMTQRFQTTVQALEEEGDAEKHQLAAMHQQRVLAHINQRKKEAMSCYTQALNENPPNTHRVQKCLQKLLRSLHKDRAHAISHYRHLLASSIEAAAREQPRVLERLTDIDRTVNQSMQMLKRYPELASRIGQLMDDYIQALRSKDETPGSLLAMTSDAEQAILDKYKAEIATKQAERERQRLQEKERKEQRKKERTELKEEKKRVEAALGKSISNIDDDDEMDENNSVLDEKPSTPVFMGSTAESTAAETVSSYVTATNRKEVDDVAVQQAVEEVAKAASHRQDVIRVAHIMSHEIGHSEPSFSVRREIYGRKDGRSVYFTLAFAGMALMAAIVVGVAVAKRRSGRSPQSQGFVEVDQAATPEERHVANMQINGYENPTYKYFEVKE